MKKNQPTQEGRQKALANALRALVKTHFEDTFGPRIDRDIDLHLDFRLNADGSCSFENPIEDQLLSQLQTALADRDVFQKGHIFCFRCESSLCEHSQPTSPTEIFGYYDELGCPRWLEFAQSLLNDGDNRVDQLYQDPPSILTRLQDATMLQDRRLRAFGKASKSYAILFQVTWGFIQLKQPIFEKAAFSLQAVETRDRTGLPKIHLNVLIPKEHEGIWDPIRTQPEFEWILLAFKKAQKTIATLNNGGAAKQNKQGVGSVMRQFQRDLNQGQRKSQKQTRHAQDRKRIDRPTFRALEDIGQASSERFFLDRKTAAVVILGPKGRCHVFNREGRHITSFHISMESVQSRLHKKRWEYLESIDRMDFLHRIENQT